MKCRVCNRYVSYVGCVVWCGFCGTLDDGKDGLYTPALIDIKIEQKEIELPQERLDILNYI